MSNLTPSVPEQSDVRLIVSEAMHTYKSMVPPEVSFDCTVSTKVPAVFTLDAVRVKQVLSNGITNALKYTVSGGVTVQVQPIIVLNKPHLLFQVIDTGVGLSADIDSRSLFDPMDTHGTCTCL